MKKAMTFRLGEGARAQLAWLSGEWEMSATGVVESLLMGTGFDWDIKGEDRGKEEGLVSEACEKPTEAIEPEPRPKSRRKQASEDGFLIPKGSWK